MEIKLTILGNPSRTTHQSGTRNTKFGRTYKNKNLSDEELRLGAAFSEIFEQHSDVFPLVDPIEIVYKIYYEVKEKIKDERKTTKPDWDNIPKTIQDVMVKCGLIKDDAIIWSGTCKKFVTSVGNGRIEITITK